MCFLLFVICYFCFGFYCVGICGCGLLFVIFGFWFYCLLFSMCFLLFVICYLLLLVLLHDHLLVWFVICYLLFLILLLGHLWLWLVICCLLFLVFKFYCVAICSCGLLFVFWYSMLLVFFVWPSVAVVCYLMLLVLLRGHLWLWEAAVYGQVPPSQEGNNLLPRPLPENMTLKLPEKYDT